MGIVTRILSMLGLTAAALLAMDLAVTTMLHVGEARIGLVARLSSYFDYGRSVPGKLDRWLERPGLRGNLFDVGWIPDIVADSATAFEAEVRGRHVRGYGMSFSNHILEAAGRLDPTLPVDLHAGPSAPPNHALALFLEDRANRRPGDIVVLGLLSWSAPAMAAMSNRTWLFEQPAPFTYPVFRATPEGLTRADPLIRTAAQERTAQSDAALAARWQTQLGREDMFYSAAAFALPSLDVSPFMRLVRRALALGTIDRRRAAMHGDVGGWTADKAETLRAMIRHFAVIARQDGQFPVVLLIQSRNRGGPDLAAIARPMLENEGIAHIATVDHQDPADPRGFLPDGHYREEPNRRFAEAFLALLPPEGKPR